MQNRHLQTCAIFAAIGLLLFRSLGVWIIGFLGGWKDMSPWSILFLMLPPMAAVSALGIGHKYARRAFGMTGFFASALLFSVWPGILATLVILYSVTSRPFYLTSVWTALAAGVAIIPTIHHRMWGGDLLYAGSWGHFLAATALISGSLLLVSAASIIVHLIRRTKPGKRASTAAGRAQV